MLTHDSYKRPSFRELMNDKIFIKHLPIPPVYQFMNKIDCFRKSEILNEDQLSQLFGILDDEYGAEHYSRLHFNFIFRITPEEFNKGKRGENKTLRQKQKKHLQTVKRVVNFIVLIKTDKTDEPMGFFVPMSHW